MKQQNIASCNTRSDANGIVPFSSFISHHSSLQFKKSFTLIELLVVIAIIAILAGMLLPALSNIKETARTQICLTNEKNILMLFRSYADSNDDYPPEGEYAYPANYSYWQDYFSVDYNAPKYKYGSTVNPTQTIWYCPSHPIDRYKASNLKNSYGYNTYGMHVTHSLAPWKCPLAKTTVYKRPAATYWVAENFSDNAASCAGGNGVYLTDATTINSGCVAYRHNRKASYGFFDGHAESKEMKDTPTSQYYEYASMDVGVKLNTWFICGVPSSDATWNGF